MTISKMYGTAVNPFLLSSRDNYFLAINPFLKHKESKTIFDPTVLPSSQKR